MLATIYMQTFRNLLLFYVILAQCYRLLVKILGFSRGSRWGNVEPRTKSPYEELMERLVFYLSQQAGVGGLRELGCGAGVRDEGFGQASCLNTRLPFLEQ